MNCVIFALMPNNILVFTFDDNNSSNRLAAEMLHERGIQGIFLLNDGPDLKEQVEMLKKYNQIIGNHTRSHRFMAEFTDEDFKYEVEDFNKELEELVGEPVTWFSYPYSNRSNKQELRQRIVDMFPNRLRGTMEPIATCENDTADHLRTPVGGYDIDYIDIYLKDNTCILQMHGITKEHDWDISLDYFNKLLDLWKKSQLSFTPSEDQIANHNYWKALKNTTQK